LGEVQPGNAVRNSTGTTGTISYCAPEVLKVDASGRFGNFTVKSDVFSLGMILYFLCFGRLPYRNANAVQEELEDIDLLRAEITDWKGFQDERFERPELPLRLYQLLKRMLAINPADRPTASEVLTMMGYESHQGGLRGRTRSKSPTIGLHNRRIQSLDSPMAPGTPVPEPVKYRGGPNLQGDHGPSTPKVASHAMVVSRSQDGFPPERSSDILSQRISLAQHPPAVINTPLLPAPPTTLSSTIEQRLRLMYHDVMRFNHEYTEMLLFFGRLGLFFAKVASLTKPCWPYMVNLQLGGALVTIAAVDLSLSRQPVSPLSGWRASVVLLVLHFLVLWAASRWGTVCAEIRDEWDW
jgi:serine/threonine protein kinase